MSLKKRSGPLHGSWKGVWPSVYVVVYFNLSMNIWETKYLETTVQLVIFIVISTPLPKGTTKNNKWMKLILIHKCFLPFRNIWTGDVLKKGKYITTYHHDWWTRPNSCLLIFKFIFCRDTSMKDNQNFPQYRRHTSIQVTKQITLANSVLNQFDPKCIFPICLPNQRKSTSSVTQWGN